MTRRNKYLEQIYAIFLTENIEGLTLSDIATRINITKMTLYNNFKDKNEIIESVINYRSQKYIEFFDKVDSKNKNAIEVLMTALEFQRDNPLIIVSHLYRSLIKSYPAQFKEHEKRFKFSLINFIKNNIKQGQKENIFRADVDADEISSYLAMTMDSMMSSLLKTNEPLNLDAMHENMIKYHVRGIANERGLKILNSKIDNKI